MFRGRQSTRHKDRKAKAIVSVASVFNRPKKKQPQTTVGVETAAKWNRKQVKNVQIANPKMLKWIMTEICILYRHIR